MGIMKQESFFEYIGQITGADEAACRKAAERQASLVKPPGSLGELESISIKLAGITGQVKNRIERPAVLIFSADNGVAKEGVTSAPQSVTRSQTINFTRKLTGAGALSENFGIDLLVIDTGIDGDLPAELLTDKPAEMCAGKILDRKIARGTRDLAEEPAMDRNQLMMAFSAGIEAAEAAFEAGYDIAGIGEMGIGNTTTSTAVLCALTGTAPSEITGRGGGLTDKALEHKIKVIEDALNKHGLNRDHRAELEEACEICEMTCSKEHILEILETVGGFDIAAMTAAFLAAAKHRRPVVIDGYISAVAALAAYMLAPDVRDYMFASHVSEEPGYDLAMKRIGLAAMLDLRMRLGEGSGCILAFQIIKGACGVMNDMATFAEAEINDDYLEEIRRSI